MDPSAGVTAAGRPWVSLEGGDRHAATLAAVKAGDREALDVLVADLSPLMWHVARGAELDREQAADVVQTVWLAFLRHLDRLSEPRAIAGWVITTTRREAQRVRSRAAAIDGQDILDQAAEYLASDGPGPEEHALRGERDRLLWTAFVHLPVRQQELLRLTVLSGRAEYRPVAEALGVSLGSVGPLRGRALHQLRKLYQELSEEPSIRYLPLGAPLAPTADMVALSVWRLGVGELAIPVYPSPERLYDALGAEQPWVAVQQNRLPDLLRATHAHRFLSGSTPEAVHATTETVTLDRQLIPMMGSFAMPAPEQTVSQHDTLRDLLSHNRPPPGPATEPWSISFDGLGKVRITPSEIAFDDEVVPWDKVTEVRTRNVLDYLRADALRLQIGNTELSKAVLALTIETTKDELDNRGADLPIAAELEYTDHLARRKTLHANATVAVFLADRAVHECVLATARSHAIPVSLAEPDRATAVRNLEALQAELTKLTE